MAISSKKDVVSDVVGVKMLQSSVSVCHIALLTLENKINGSFILNLHSSCHQEESHHHPNSQ